MPNLLLEYSDNLRDAPDFKKLFLTLHEITHQITGAPIENCKSRAQQVQTFLIGVGGDHKAFLSLNLSLIEGRSLAVKQALGEALLQSLQDFFPQSKTALSLQITVEIRDISKAQYFKYPANTLSTPASNTR